MQPCPLHYAPSQLARSICFVWEGVGHNLLKAYTWFCSQGLLSACLGHHTEFWGSNSGQSQTRQAPYLLLLLQSLSVLFDCSLFTCHPPQGRRLLESENWPLPGVYVFSLHYSWPFLRKILPCHLLSSFGKCYFVRVSVNSSYLSWYSAINLSMGTAFTPAQLLFCHL